MRTNSKKRYESLGTVTATVGYKGRVSGSQTGCANAQPCSIGIGIGIGIVSAAGQPLCAEPMSSQSVLE
ncbi:hypothetical protein [Pseudomonas sp. GM74]|uniref:hypothetical protein n=1 Tax=Pseudomonas sp. GM74 TaxID=1144336 RepID=UPI0002F8D1A4|nr:hypothetical protein [Pseudomonas sp. GM74]